MSLRKADPQAEPAAKPAVVKKYANRRLYNTATSSYVTLDDLSCTDKTMPEFADLWQGMIDISQLDTSAQEGGTTPPDPFGKAGVA